MIMNSICKTALRARTANSPHLAPMELPPDFADEARSIAMFRQSLESQKLGRLPPAQAKASVAAWHSDVQDLTSKLAAQLNYSR